MSCGGYEILAFAPAQDACVSSCATIGIAGIGFKCTMFDGALPSRICGFKLKITQLRCSNKEICNAIH